jgi:excinuclease ABC subunit A
MRSRQTTDERRHGAEWISVRGAAEHNLREIDLELPRRALIGVGGVSGSGKSSLAFDTIFREGQRRFLESLSTYARHFLGALARPQVALIGGLSPAIAVDQRSLPRSPRSTVGTVSGCLDVLRLLFARLGQRPDATNTGATDAGATDAGATDAGATNAGATSASRALFSFNSPVGACATCQGLGVEDRVDPELLLADPSRTLRQGALVPTTKRGYIVYSQVTPEVMGQIAAAHGFDLDTPWAELTDEQRAVVLYGSRKLQVPFGKHSLESRMRWSGITARPREVGYYRGIVPVIEEILTRDRNENALRFARSRPCSACAGKRLSAEALAFEVGGVDIAEVCRLSVAELSRWSDIPRDPEGLWRPIATSLRTRLALLRKLGLAHLTLDRAAPSLSSGEARRLRLCAQLCSGLSGLLYVLDEPSAGLHAAESAALIETLEALREQDNTVLVVEHDTQILAACDWLVEIGPGPGAAGGRVVVSDEPARLRDDPRARQASATLRQILHDGSRALRGHEAANHAMSAATSAPATDATLTIRGAHAHNLREFDVSLPLGRLVALCGLSGAGKSTLLRDVLGATLRRRQATHDAALEGCRGLDGAETITRVLTVDDTPIGRTPRSNPATYTKLFDLIRKRFAAEPLAKEAGLGASAFSFNTKGGRCERCEGAGVRSVGMHFLPNVEVPCEACGGRRFAPEVLAVRVDGRSIDEVLALRVDEAHEAFSTLPKATLLIDALIDVGLGYLTLGQPSTTLSGGEAQRVKLAAELGRRQRGAALYLLDEPTTGLAPTDVERLTRVLRRLVDEGHTVVVAEHDLDLLADVDILLELGPGSGADGGQLIATGSPAELARADTPTGRALAAWSQGDCTTLAAAQATGPANGQAAGGEPDVERRAAISLEGVRTHGLKGFDVSFPLGQLTVVTGLSGSGKSSLVFDTLAAEAQRRYTETLSAHARRFVSRLAQAELDNVDRLRPAVAIGQAPPARSPRSTVGTMTEIYDLLRLLYARLGEADPRTGDPASGPLSARHFSFNHELGACPSCGGLGSVERVDETLLISDPQRSLCDGALDGHPRGRFYGEPDGQYVATLRAVGEALDVDVERPWAELDAAARALALRGAGERSFSVRWRFKRGKRAGEHHFEGPWLGFATLLEQEHERTSDDHLGSTRASSGRGSQLEALLRAEPCAACEGMRLSPQVLAMRLGGLNIGELCRLSVDQVAAFFERLTLSSNAAAISAEGRREIARRLRALSRLGLGYLGLERASSTLSAGEARRVRLAAQLGAPLTDVLYALDEPTIGLHPRDVDELWAALRELCAAGNTVVVVDHDPRLLTAADQLVELGPGAGRQGGELVFAGAPATVVEHPTALSAATLRGDRAPAAIIASRTPRAGSGTIELRGASARNLRGIDVSFPCAALVAVSGVSGSGKSTLVFEVLAASIDRGQPVGCAAVDGLDRLGAVCRVDAAPIGRTPASTPASLLGLGRELAKRFAATDAAKAAGLKASAFTPQGAAGRCPSCKGLGATRHSLDFLADVWLRCETCSGDRFRDASLAVRWRELSIAEVYTLSVSEALRRFSDLPRLGAPLELLEGIGLGYLGLGQPAPTLSGGEAQRLKLARELTSSERRGGRGDERRPTLYVLDEPTSGLHPRDVEQLVAVLDALVDRGDTVVVVEHDLDLLARADQIIDLGPGGGPAGGQLVASGTPAELMRCDASATGCALRDPLRGLGS